MTPKEKAQDLVNRYRAILMNENTDCGEEILCTTIAKKIATSCTAGLYPRGGGRERRNLGGPRRV